jgi:hypothetical protein
MPAFCQWLHNGIDCCILTLLPIFHIGFYTPWWFYHAITVDTAAARTDIASFYKGTRKHFVIDRKVAIFTPS